MIGYMNLRVLQETRQEIATSTTIISDFLSRQVIALKGWPN
jgi:hypothetical protein